eukprot:SAG22_NODE_1366_length_4595_cov_5.475979_7_plen_477_part_00
MIWSFSASGNLSLAFDVSMSYASTRGRGRNSSGSRCAAKGGGGGGEMKEGKAPHSFRHASAHAPAAGMHTAGQMSHPQIRVRPSAALALWLSGSLAEKKRNVPPPQPPPPSLPPPPGCGWLAHLQADVEVCGLDRVPYPAWKGTVLDERERQWKHKAKAVPYDSLTLTEYQIPTRRSSSIETREMYGTSYSRMSVSCGVMMVMMVMMVIMVMMVMVGRRRRRRRRRTYAVVSERAGGRAGTEVLSALVPQVAARVAAAGRQAAHNFGGGGCGGGGGTLSKIMLLLLLCGPARGGRPAGRSSGPGSRRGPGRPTEARQTARKGTVLDTARARGSTAERPCLTTMHLVDRRRGLLELVPLDQRQQLALDVHQVRDVPERDLDVRLTGGGGGGVREGQHGGGGGGDPGQADTAVEKTGVSRRGLDAAAALQSPGRSATRPPLAPACRSCLPLASRSRAPPPRAGGRAWRNWRRVGGPLF